MNHAEQIAKAVHYLKAKRPNDFFMVHDFTATPYLLEFKRDRVLNIWNLYTGAREVRVRERRRIIQQGGNGK